MIRGSRVGEAVEACASNGWVLMLCSRFAGTYTVWQGDMSGHRYRHPLLFEQVQILLGTME